MTALGIDSIFTGLGLRATRLGDLIYWLTAAFIVKSVIPVIWLCFSLTYSRADYREFLTRWRIPLAVVGLLPIGLSLGFHDQLFQVVPGGTPGDVWRLQFGAIANALNAILLIALVLILMNLEQTFRSAVGTMRWRLKFVVLALVVIFGARLYVRSQAILFSAPDMALWGVESGALLIGCVFLALAYARTGWAEIAVYPSSAVLRSSLTVLIVGGYLFIVGVLAQVVRRFGGAELFPVSGLCRASGHGRPGRAAPVRPRPAEDSCVRRPPFQKGPARFREGLDVVLAAVGQRDRSGRPVRGVREIDLRNLRRVVGHPLAARRGEGAVRRRSLDRATGTARPAARIRRIPLSSAVTAGLQARSSPFDLEDVNEAWAEELRQLNSSAFPNGGNRLCVPLRAGDTEPWRPRAGRSHQWGDLHGRGTGTAEMHRRSDHLGPAESSTRE